ncbi:MAG TPA: GyrI-like domain-containing protein [Ktedonobacteraceae bacterium]
MAVDVESSLLTKAAHFPADHVRVRELPATSTMVCLLLSGSYDGLWDAYISLMTWIEDHGQRGAGPCRCIYLRRPSPGEEPASWLSVGNAPL